MVKICSYCSAENVDTNSVCQSCGRQLAESQPQTISPNEIVCTSCGRSNSPSFNNCSNCGLPLVQKSSYVEQPSAAPSQKQAKKFPWWKLFTWPFTCLGTLLTSCCGCCCGSCCDEGSKSTSVKEEVAGEVVGKVIDSIFDND